jgi:outer membrane receptor protein involved in Fe transport
MTSNAYRRPVRPRVFARACVLSVVLLIAAAATAFAAPKGKIQGKIVGTDNNDPIGFADIALIPADSTMHAIGGLTNADGTFLLEAPPGKYALRIRALSYAPKRFEGIVIEDGKVLTFDTALSSQAIQQEEVVVEAKAQHNNEASLLAARKKAVSLGDAVSAEQVRRTPDKNAAEVLRRVTGLSVSDGKYVFVRGLGERYSSTEIDGVRITSPEQNKRVVPMDMLPASLLDNIVVQKTYTADRPGEFGGGDVQVHTKDFPGARTFFASVELGIREGTTFDDRMTYDGGAKFGVGSRELPVAVDGAQLPAPTNANLPRLAALGRDFTGVWSPRAERTVPNGQYALTYGDELKLLGRPLGLVGSLNFLRGYDHQEESQRFFVSNDDTLYDYDVERWTETSQLGGLAAVNYRLSPRHALHVRGVYSNSVDDEVRTYEGPDHNRQDIYGNPLVHQGTRLLYVQRDVMSGALEGEHEFPRVLGTHFEWRLTKSNARRQQPDRREYIYDKRYYFEGDTAHWILGSLGGREYGDTKEDGNGVTLNTFVPYRLFKGNGKVSLGYDKQNKDRTNLYRRFQMVPSDRVRYGELPGDSLFNPDNNDGAPGTGYVQETTLNEYHGSVDNYTANQNVEAGYASTDVPLGKRLRMNLGVRVEHGTQDVISFYEFRPDSTLQEGHLDNVDWLPSANLTWSMTDAINVRVAASRTLSRPDLNELSPSPFLEYVGGFLVKGNPELERARIDNYDFRLEAFPGLGEVLAAGVFYKNLYQPIEQVIQGGNQNLLVPRNSDRGHNAGVELEARAGLGRLWGRMRRLSLNTNASIISSKILLPPQVSLLGTQEHPLQGQADYLVNVAMMYTSRDHRFDGAVLYGLVGKRLKALGLYPLPDVYEQPSSSLDATFNTLLLEQMRMKVSLRNLLDPRIQQLQDGKEVSGYHRGRAVSVSFAYGW